MGMSMNWWEIALKLKDPFDYDEFCHACTISDFEPLPVFEYAQKMGMLAVAIKRFKSGCAETDYRAFIQEMNSAASQKSTTNSTGGCGGCGKKS